MPSIKRLFRPAQAAIVSATVLVGVCLAAAPAQASTTTARALMYKVSVAAESNTGYDIDHHVALSEAWRSGARSWTSTDRRAYANDTYGPTLNAITDNLNGSKGDRDPAPTPTPTRAR